MERSFAVCTTRAGRDLLRRFATKGYWKDLHAYTDNRHLLDRTLTTWTLATECLWVLSRAPYPTASQPADLFLAFARHIRVTTGVDYADNVWLPIWEQLGQRRLIRVYDLRSSGAHVPFVVPALIDEQVWMKMTRADEETLWAYVYTHLHWQPSAGPTAFRPPDPATTWSIAAVYGDQREARETDLNLKVLRALRRCIKPDARIAALDWHHQCYWFWPRRFTEGSRCSAWAVPVLPDGDWHLFLAEDRRFGVLGHPWESTLCVYGSDLLAALALDLPLVLRTDQAAISSS